MPPMSHTPTGGPRGERRAVLTQWYVADGATVEPDDPICELATDCATVDMVAPHGGVLRHLVRAGTRLTSDHDCASIDPP